MRKVFSSIEVSETMLVKDALLQHGIDVTIRIVGDTLATLDDRSEAPPWVCPACREENPQSFETCWSCGRERPVATGDGA